MPGNDTRQEQAGTSLVLPGLFANFHGFHGFDHDHRPTVAASGVNDNQPGSVTTATELKEIAASWRPARREFAPTTSLHPSVLFQSGSNSRTSSSKRELHVPRNISHVARGNAAERAAWEFSVRQRCKAPVLQPIPPVLRTTPASIRERSRRDLLQIERARKESVAMIVRTPSCPTNAADPAMPCCVGKAPLSMDSKPIAKKFTEVRLHRLRTGHQDFIAEASSRTAEASAYAHQSGEQDVSGAAVCELSAVGVPGSTGGPNVAQQQQQQQQEQQRSTLGTELLRQHAENLVVHTMNLMRTTQRRVSNRVDESSLSFREARQLQLARLLGKGRPTQDPRHSPTPPPPFPAASSGAPHPFLSRLRKVAILDPLPLTRSAADDEFANVQLEDDGDGKWEDV